MENTNDTHNVKRSFSLWVGEMREFLRGHFSLDEDKAQRDEVVAAISKGVVFRGVNLWVLIFATMIASLGLNVNSAAVIIGAMLISPIMGPIMGIGLSLGINDFELLKKALRNYALMFIVAIITSTVYFLVSPLSSNSSELLARTVPTTYDVLIALFGGLAGIVAQTRQDRTSTVIPGVAIATALIPPLCTAGFGLATGQIKFFVGAFYLFFINSVFIALATYLMVRFLKYEKNAFIDKVRERNVKRLMMVITLVTFIPSVVIGFHMVRVSLFEAVADKYVAQVFKFPHTRVIECNKHYAHGKDPSQIELLLVGEPIGDEIIENARAQMRNFGLEKAELVVRQANKTDEINVASLQQSYLELLEEKNRRIGEMMAQLKRYRVTNVEVDDISREVGVMMENIKAISLMKGITFDVAGTPLDTTLVCVVTPKAHAEFCAEGMAGVFVARRPFLCRAAVLVQILRRREPALFHTLLLPALPHEGRERKPAQFVPGKERRGAGRHPPQFLPDAGRDIRRYGQYGPYGRRKGPHGTDGEGIRRTLQGRARPRLDRYDGPFRLLGVLFLLGALRTLADVGGGVSSPAQQGHGAALPAFAQL